MTWRTVALGEHVASRTGSVIPSNFPDEEFELYSIPAHDAGGPEFTQGVEIGSAKQNVQPGDVLLAKIIPHIRRVRVVGESSGRRQVASGEWIIFRTGDYEPNYLRHFLLSDRFHVQFMNTVAGVGGSLVRARPEFVKKIQAPLPPLDEQRRIAAILDQADAIRTQFLKKLARVEELRRMTITSLLDRHQDAHSSPLAEHLGFLTSGSRGWARYYAPSGDPFLRIQNVRGARIWLDDVAFVAPPLTAEARRTRTQPGDVLLSITADLGRTAVIPEWLGSAYISQHLAILRTETINPYFLAYYLESPQGKRLLMQRNRGSSKAGLNFNDVRSVMVPAIPMATQKLFAEQMKKANHVEERMQTALSSTDSLFASLQTRAFKGEL